MISTVVCGRHDTHGGQSFSRKLFQVLEWNTRVCERAQLPCIFWFVEWGREPGRDWLSPALTERFPNCRCIMVPDEIVAAAQVLPVRFQEFTAKNIGLARASTDLVIATNSDILFSEALVQFLKGLQPRDRFLYRAPRHDFQCFDAAPLMEADLIWTHKHDLGQNGCNAAGDFTAATPATWQQLCGYSESPRHVRHLDAELIIAARYLGMDLITTPPVFHRDHPESTKFVTVWNRCWGEEDEGLRLGQKLMPRNRSWGHRHCSLNLAGERLATLQLPNAPANPAGKEIPPQRSMNPIIRTDTVQPDPSRPVPTTLRPETGSASEAALERILESADPAASIAALRATWPPGLSDQVIHRLAQAKRDHDAVLQNKLQQVYVAIVLENDAPPLPARPAPSAAAA